MKILMSAFIVIINFGILYGSTVFANWEVIHLSEWTVFGRGEFLFSWFMFSGLSILVFMEATK